MFFSDINYVLSEFAKIDLKFYLIIFPLAILYMIISSWRYSCILKRIGINLQFKEYFWLFSAGESMAITPGGLGAVVKSYLLKKKLGVSFSSTAPTIIFERWIDLAGILLLLGIISILITTVESTAVLIIGTIFLISVFAFFKTKLGFSIVKRITRKIKFFNKFVSQFDESQESAVKLFSVETILRTLPSTLVIRVIQLVMVFLIFISLDIDFDVLLTGHILFTSSMIGSLSFLPAGIIVTEASLLGLMLKNGLNLGLATVAVFLIRLVTLWFATIIGFFALKFVLSKNSH